MSAVAKAASRPRAQTLARALPIRGPEGGAGTAEAGTPAAFSAFGLVLKDKTGIVGG